MMPRNRPIWGDAQHQPHPAPRLPVDLSFSIRRPGSTLGATTWALASRRKRLTDPLPGATPPAGEQALHLFQHPRDQAKHDAECRREQEQYE